MTIQEEMNKEEMIVFAELYKIEVGGEYTYYTSYDETIIFQSREYKPATIKRGKIKEDSSFAPARLEITVQIDENLSKYISSAPADGMRIEIIRYFPDTGENYIIFFGELESVTLGGQLAIVSMYSDPEIHVGKVPKYIFQSQCNHYLFDDECGLNEDDFKHAAVVTVEDSKLISSDFAEKPNDYFTGGFAKHKESFRMIVKHEGDTCHIHAPFDSRVKNGTILYAYPGCLRDRNTCEVKFSNKDNFLGMPTIPTSNPTIWGMVT